MATEISHPVGPDNLEQLEEYFRKRGGQDWGGYLCAFRFPIEKWTPNMRMSEDDYLDEAQLRVGMELSHAEGVWYNYMSAEQNCYGMMRCSPRDIIFTFMRFRDRLFRVFDNQHYLVMFRWVRKE